MTVAKPAWYNGWIQPESPATSSANSAPIYPYNNVLIHDESGNIIETDSTPDRERIRISHRTGTFIEMMPNSDEIHKVYGNNYIITVKDNNVLIQGNCNITIESDCNIEIFGDKTELIHGNYELHVKGSMSQTVDGIGSILSQQDMTIGGGGLSDGSIRMKTGDHLYLEGDLTIGGEFTAKKITSETRIDAGYGVSAGTGGFTTMSGGLFIGLPGDGIPDPTGELRNTPNPLGNMIICNGPISALGELGVVTADMAVVSVIGLLDINNIIYNVHFHPCLVGPTGPPVILMP
jgi:hypothetical protein